MIQTDWTWSSHLPLLKAAVEVFKPEFILELGSGLFSTPILAAAGAPMWCIDNDLQWLQRVKDSNRAHRNVVYFHHDLGPEVTVGTKQRELSPTKRAEIAAFYDTLSQNLPDAPRRLAFVDQFTATRTMSINSLLGAVDIVIYHDCEPEGISWYEYQFDDRKSSQYEHYTFKTPIVWTGLFVKKSFGFDGFELCRRCWLHSDRYAKDHGLDPTELSLQRGS